MQQAVFDTSHVSKTKLITPHFPKLQLGKNKEKHPLNLDFLYRESPKARVQYRTP